MIPQQRKETAVQVLSKNPLLHVDMLESITGNSANLLWAGKHGVLLFQTSAEVYMMSSDDEETAKSMLGRITNASLFVVHQDFYRKAVQEKFGLPKRMECRQAVYQKREFLPALPSSAEIQSLDESYLPFLMEHYTHADDAEYLRDRLKAGHVFGAFLGTALTGFIGMHEEGSMGMLEVLPKYRRKGIASTLETFLINRILARGRVPYAQIETGNEMSLALHRKLGFSISDGKVNWLMK